MNSIDILRGKTILIVDDEALIRECFVYEFKYYGMNVLEACDGNEAFAIVLKHKIDIVFSDIRMPNCDGLKLLRLIKEYNPNMPVILMSGFSNPIPDDLLKKWDIKIFDKPPNWDEIILCIINEIEKI